jgi:hypothetical protein
MCPDVIALFLLTMRQIELQEGVPEYCQAGCNPIVRRSLRVPCDAIV